MWMSVHSRYGVFDKDKGGRYEGNNKVGPRYKGPMKKTYFERI